MGLLTQADGGRGHGPPDRFAVAELVRGTGLKRFLSDEGEWKTVVSKPCLSLPPRELLAMQETLAFGGRLWSVDLTFGVISADPFDDRPEICCIELPSGSVLPARAPIDRVRRRADETAMFMREVAKYRLVGVSEGRLRYTELTPGKPFLLRSFALDDEGSACWTLEHQVELRQVLEDGGYPWQNNSAAPRIAVLDPFNASAVHIKVGEHVLVVVDILHNGKVIGASQNQDNRFSLVPCVLPPLLGASRIPTTGNHLLASTASTNPLTFGGTAAFTPIILCLEPWTELCDFLLIIWGMSFLIGISMFPLFVESSLIR
jgi:hypothetical protein